MSFDVAAVAYDRYMGRWSSLLSEQLADLADIAAGRRTLDVGCGPGALTATLVARVGPDNVAAVDPAEGFVAATRHRYPGVDVRLASAEALPYPDETFDASLAQLVVHFLTDPVAGLREMARVTRPGGTVAASVWDYGGGRGPLGPFWEEARSLDPAAVDESELAGAKKGHLAALFDAAGLGHIEQAELEARREFMGFDDWWTPFTKGVGPGGAYLASLPDERRTELRERCRSALPPGPFVLAATAWAARGSAR